MRSIIYIIFISVLFSSIGQVASDLYLPSLPAISVGLHASVNMVQATVFAYMIGFSVSRLIYGPLSDAVGRKQPLIVGLSMCLLGTFICLLANSIGILITGRLLQGFGSGAGVVLASAIIRDTAEDSDLAKLYSYTSMSIIVMIASAPLLGGYLQHLFGWRASFVFIALYILFALLVSIFISETNTHRTMENLRPRKIKTNLITLFANRKFAVFGASIFLTYANILAWLTLGPVLLQNTVGITPIAFGWIALFGGVVYGCGAFLNSKLVNRYAINQIIKFGAFLIVISGLFMLVSSLLGIINLWIIIMPVLIVLFGNSIIFPNAFAGALTPFPQIAGIAGAVLGFMQVLGGSISSGIISALPDNTQLPLAMAYIICGLTTFLIIKFGLYDDHAK